ncbi:MAG TPA: DUF6588 family protein [Mucilaginibacter sp.]|jgi:hypothetical protein|nr:DUF6588 family protein [Mucilaginibacter sp.]
MNKPYSLLTGVILFFTAFTARGQSSGGGFGQLIKASPGDITKLVQNYIDPLFKGLGTGLNGGWNNTAKAKKPLHFDLRISASAAFVPEMDKSFDVTKIGLSSHVTPKDPSNVFAPTIGGAKTAGPTMYINDDQGNHINTFIMPQGQLPSLGQSPLVPAPNVQLQFGIIKNTDITVRASPTINLNNGDGTINTFGFGIKHDIIQDFATKKKIIPFDLAIAVNYNKITYSRPLNVQPNSGSQPAPGNQAADFSTQKFDATVSGLDFQAIISKKLRSFTPFFSLAYQTANSTANIRGNFPIESTAPGQSGYYVVVSDPVNISETSISGLRANAGFQLNLGFFRIYASYSVGQYQSVNGGIGFGF